jgi:hypothetical protein
VRSGPGDAASVDTRAWGEEGGAYSDDGLYRWSYERAIGNGGTICWIGLNPGTGDSEGRYRPTLQRMVDRSVSLGMGTFILVNLFAWRSTKPAALRAAHVAGIDIVGSGCDAAIGHAAARADVVIGAWGAHGRLAGRDQRVLADLGRVHCLGLTGRGLPRHLRHPPHRIASQGARQRSPVRRRLGRPRSAAAASLR